MPVEYAVIFNWMLALVVSLSCHEFAHALFASMQGDDTAKDEGRMTLNPIAHIDLMGTIVLPLIMLLGSGGILGWAKPVPVNLRNLRNPKWGHVLVAFAGPLANLLLCLAFIIFEVVYKKFGQSLAMQNDLVLAITGPMIRINAILAVFNLLPLAPLDGGTVFSAFLPRGLKDIYDQYVAPNGMFILLALMISGSLHWVSKMSSLYINVIETGMWKILS